MPAAVARRRSGCHVRLARLLQYRQRRLHIGIRHMLERGSHGRCRFARRQTLFDRAMSLHMRIEQLLQQSAVFLIECAALHEDLAQRPILGHRPGVHRLDELVARDKVVLQGQNAQQQIAVGRLSHRSTLRKGLETVQVTGSPDHRAGHYLPALNDDGRDAAALPRLRPTVRSQRPHGDIASQQAAGCRRVTA